MKTLKTSKKDKEGFAQPRDETLRKPSQAISLSSLTMLFMNQLGTERTI